MKNKQPLVSIITPSYNQGQFLEETIRSVFLQYYPRIEYIIVDGGSTDNTRSIIERYKNKLAWYVSEKDQGQAHAINKGFAKATGEIVAWINSDDIYTEHAVSCAVEQLVKNPDCGMVYANVLSIDSDSSIFNTMEYGDWGLEELMQFNIIGQAGVFMRTTVLQSVNFLDSNFHYLMDHQLWLKIASRYLVKHIDEFWAAARYHPNAKNISQPFGFGEDAFRIYNWIQTQPDLLKCFIEHKPKIKAGAYRLKARYLLDGGSNWKAFTSYLRSVLLDPKVLIQEKNRIMYSFLNSIVNVEKLKQQYLNNRSGKVAHQDLNYLIDYLK
jgi:glycosyltransferase involved in cell wall biosynthesis